GRRERSAVAQSVRRRGDADDRRLHAPGRARLRGLRRYRDPGAFRARAPLVRDLQAAAERPGMTPRPIEHPHRAAGGDSVWEPPRPPRVEASQRHIVVVVAGEVVADTRRALRVLRANQPPVYFVPPEDYRRACFRPSAHETFCEFKGVARHYDIAVGEHVAREPFCECRGVARHYDIVVGEHVAREAAWSYPNPAPRYAVLADHMAIHPARVDACFVDGERVRPQEGGIHEGWITSDIGGPAKGR